MAKQYAKSSNRRSSNVSWQFLRREITRTKPTKAIEMCMAVWGHDGEHIAIGAPTPERLAMAWLEITGMEMESAMRVEVIPFLSEVNK